MPNPSLHSQRRLSYSRVATGTSRQRPLFERAGHLSRCPSTGSVTATTIKSQSSSAAAWDDWATLVSGGSVSSEVSRRRSYSCTDGRPRRFQSRIH